MSLVLNGTTGITNLPSINSGQIGGRRNIVINGEMKVAQRSTSAAGLGAASGYFTLDRWILQQRVQQDDLQWRKLLMALQDLLTV
jgi:hypothetical protein